MSIDATIQSVIDLEALEGNLRHAERLAGAGQRMIAAVKGNAYGHGAVEIGLALERLGVFALATGSVAEARAMRAAGVALPIVMFAATPPAGAALLAAEGLIPSITNFESAQAVSSSARNAAPVYIKVDAGLGRLGVPIDEARAFVGRCARLSKLRIEGIYTHLPFGNRTAQKWSAARLAAFDAFLADLAGDGYEIPVTQARGSSCLLAGHQDTCNAVCAGHLLYGLSPFASNDVADVSILRPVLRQVTTRLIHVGHHGQGADLAIGGLYGIERARTLGVLPVGLAHGCARTAAGQSASVLVGGKRARVLAVSLEHTTIDLDGLDDATPGDEVTLLGVDGDEHITLEDVARWVGKLPLEIALGWSGQAELATVDPARDARAGFARG